MEFEKVFINNYKKICMDITDERIDSRINGIKAVMDEFSSYAKINEIVMSCKDREDKISNRELDNA